MKEDKMIKFVKEMKNHTAEDNICNIGTLILNTPYNWSLVALTVVIWFFSSFMLSSFIGAGSSFAAVAAIAIGFFKRDKYSKNLIGLGIFSCVLIMFTTVISVSLLSQGVYGGSILTPLNIFCFTLLLKNIWNAGMAG